MEEAARQVKRKILEVCLQAQEQLGGAPLGPVVVLNALMYATAEYAVGTTTADPEEGVGRFNSLSMKLAKVIQEFLAEHTGGAAIIELPEKP